MKTMLSNKSQTYTELRRELSERRLIDILEIKILRTQIEVKKLIQQVDVKSQRCADYILGK